MRCYCCSQKTFENCCEPFILNKQFPDTAEQLMRSRFTAYCVCDYGYILNTYDSASRANLTIQALEESAAGSKWFALQITETGEPDTVEFFAFYFLAGKPYLLHETSRFIKESNRWVYQSGELHEDCGKAEIGRNSACPCLSGKKFKQCCLKSVR